MPAVALDNIRVAAPCSASWENMTGDARARHCQECKLNVYNLSDMTRGEAERLIASHEGRLCVRFYRRADGTILTRDCPRGLRVLTERISRIAGAALSAMISVSFVAAQTAHPTAPTVQQNAKRGSLVVRVIDQTGATIAGARVILTDDNGRSTRIVSDSNGQARFSELVGGIYTISVSAQHFKNTQQVVQVVEGTTTGIESSLPLNLNVLQGAVVVVEPPKVAVEDTVTNPELSPRKQQPSKKVKQLR